jgi:hypothetical protein
MQVELQDAKVNNFSIIYVIPVKRCLVFDFVKHLFIKYKLALNEEVGKLTYDRFDQATVII